jgi:hypothetical protein
MATIAPYGPDTTTGQTVPLDVTDTMTNVAIIARGGDTPGTVSLFEDADATALTIGGGTNYAGTTLGKDGVADSLLGGLNIGSTTDAYSTGEISVGLTGAGRMSFSQSATTLTVYDASNVANVLLDADAVEIKVGWVTDEGTKLGVDGLTGNAASSSDTPGQAVGLTGGAGNG